MNQNTSFLQIITTNVTNNDLSELTSIEFENHTDLKANIGARLQLTLLTINASYTVTQSGYKLYTAGVGVRLKIVRFIILIFLLGIATLTNAQNFQSGLITGISTSQVSGDALGGFNKIGLQLGGFVNHPLGKNSKGQFGLYYIDKGSDDTKSLFQIDLSYVESSYSILYNYQEFIWEGGVLIGALLMEKHTTDMVTKMQLKASLISLTLVQSLRLGKNFCLNFKCFGKLPIPFLCFPVQEHPAYVSILNKGKMNAVLSFSFRYLLGDE